MNQTLCSMVSPMYRLLRRVMTMDLIPKLLRGELRGENSRFEGSLCPRNEVLRPCYSDICRGSVLFYLRR